MAGVVVRDRTCRRLLVLYATHADRSWCGQMSVKEAAAALSVSSDTVVVHRKHLSGKDGGEVLVRFKRDSARARRGDRYIGRHVDTYILQSGVLGIEHVDPIPVGRNAEESWAYAVLAAAAWWTPTDRDQTFGAVRLLRRILVTNRWPSVEVTRRIDVVPYNPPNDHLALLSALLRDCMAPYVLSAREFVTGEPEALVTCVGCWRGIRRGQGARDGDLCGDCRRQAAGVPASGHGGLLPLAAGHTGHRVLEDPPF
ncbi:hypothetical protein [Streptomyces sp. Isolate_45]|uniref:hypothetical protein n=1 Tax=Streptomyces sp. Isolate_45 TaxID=2950111 RepID=UPI002481B60D|nr:hypothetical protein [Streptomyces sp. Isolate_45]MDA5284640.1 hypothetical protein [Streptomyces sp. Isolate_45]